ncbi:MAG: LLM class flavin-dependent oxidoreductase, partial [Pseudomonadota bacterium]
ELDGVGASTTQQGCCAHGPPSVDDSSGKGRRHRSIHGWKVRHAVAVARDRQAVDGELRIRGRLGEATLEEGARARLVGDRGREADVVMPVEMIGWIAPQVSSEIIAPTGPVFDKDVIAHTARVHEDADFDRVLIGYFSNAPDGFLVGAHAAAVTNRLGFLLAHRPGFVAPTVAARKLATLDQLCDGRLAVHLIAGGNDADQAKDGDHVDKQGRYRRTEEYAQILKSTWTETAPFDFDGEYYQIERAYASIRCVSESGIPLYGGGGSDDAVKSLAPYLDTFMLWGEPLADTEAFMQRVKDAARGNELSFSVSTRPILGKTEDEAWDRAHSILDKIEQNMGRRKKDPQNAASQRLLDAASKKDVYDSCLYMALATASGAPGNSTALVGTPETVAEAMAAYYDVGATTLLIRGYDPLPDAIEYGQELIPRVRELVAERDRG